MARGSGAILGAAVATLYAVAHLDVPATGPAQLVGPAVAVIGDTAFLPAPALTPPIPVP